MYSALFTGLGWVKNGQPAPNSDDDSRRLYPQELLKEPANTLMNGVRRARLKLIALMAPPLGEAFMLSQFLRSTPAVIALDLRSELHLSAAELASLPAAMILASALMQVPVGGLPERFG